MTKARKLPSQEVLNQMLDYNAETGRLTWKARDISFFTEGGHTAAHNRDKWNKKFAGKPALTCVGSDGYLKGAIANKTTRAHRAIWKMMTGQDPETVDHVDGNRANNVWGNLRDVPTKVNTKNSARPSSHTNPHVGVRKSGEGWQAYLNADGNFVHFGVFKTIEEAIAARKAGQIAYGFHPNHGRLAVK